MKLESLKGIGKKTQQLFFKAGVKSVEDLLYYYPRYYDIYGAPVSAVDLESGETYAVRARVSKEISVRRLNNKSITTAYLLDDMGNSITAVWFNSPYIKNMLFVGSYMIFRGNVREYRGSLSLNQPKIFEIEEYERQVGIMQPVYPLVAGLTNSIVKNAVSKALDIISADEILPLSVRKNYDLEEILEALKNMHFPHDRNEFFKARKRMVFEEFFRFIWKINDIHESNVKNQNLYKMEEPREVKDFIKKLPYDLTNAQKETWEDIKQDFASDHTTNRLIQGDVGSGKTIIAVLALITAAISGYQGAFMAPTEVLARQHYENVINMFNEYGIDICVVLLVGSMTASEKRDAYEMIGSGKAGIIIGTHALIQDKVQYNDLALVITDEQHRFGVSQREKMASKGKRPHVIVMSATPIPRTLSIILYGDLNISVIDELPKGRIPIANCVVDTSYRKNAYNFIKKQVQSGYQAYVICPSVEYSEQMEGENVIEYADMLKSIMPKDIKIEYLHGRMKSAQKQEIMERFSKNEINILVSTTVVEVGVDVQNATVMMVENAERFGLAQLHQLRGRVGRGNARSYCIFVNCSGKEEAQKRLEILCSSNDGFFIANEDLKLRGPGDFFGVRQSGDFGFKLGDIIGDSSLLKDASHAVNAIKNKELSITKEEYDKLEKSCEGSVSI